MGPIGSGILPQPARVVETPLMILSRYVFGSAQGLPSAVSTGALAGLSLVGRDVVVLYSELDAEPLEFL